MMIDWVWYHNPYILMTVLVLCVVVLGILLMSLDNVKDSQEYKNEVQDQIDDYWKETKEKKKERWSIVRMAYHSQCSYCGTKHNEDGECRNCGATESRVI